MISSRVKLTSTAANSVDLVKDISCYVLYKCCFRSVCYMFLAKNFISDAAEFLQRLVIDCDSEAIL